jgi:hypothetical protein
MVHNGFMATPTVESDKFRELGAFRKKDLAVRKALGKRKARLNASQNALRVEETVIGGKLAANRGLKPSPPSG